MNRGGFPLDYFFGPSMLKVSKMKILDYFLILIAFIIALIVSITAGYIVNSYYGVHSQDTKKISTSMSVKENEDPFDGYDYSSLKISALDDCWDRFDLQSISDFNKSDVPRVKLTLSKWEEFNKKIKSAKLREAYNEWLNFYKNKTNEQIVRFEVRKQITASLKDVHSYASNIK